MKMSVTMARLSALLVAFSLCAPVALARDVKHHMPIQDALELGKAEGKLDEEIGFYFSGQTNPAVETKLAPGVVTNKRTNSVEKTPKEACQWAMLLALIELQDRARKEGGNAIINIESYYKKKSFKSKDQYECHDGRIVSSVSLKGDVVKLSEEDADKPAGGAAKPGSNAAKPSK